MHIFFSGIGGVGLGPLAEIAAGAGYDVSGSDLAEGLTTGELRSIGIDVRVYPQDGSVMREINAVRPIDWFVYTSALPPDHPELVLARELGIRASKRDELLSHIIEEKRLKLIAVAGTHGKTTTTGMLVWAFTRLGIPVSYSVGTTLGFGPSGLYDAAAEYFVYECDEYDRNFLAFHPDISLVTTLDHDHFDTYPTEEEYIGAFRQFASQSRHVVSWAANRPALGAAANVRYLGEPDAGLTLTGEHNRRNASLALSVLADVLPVAAGEIADVLNGFPGTGRRFEKLAPGLYSDYGHHPVEIAATLQMAHELGKPVVLVYQPHQNSRQHEVRQDYTADVFRYADRVYWLPTYLTREPDGQPVLTPADLSAEIAGKTVIAGPDDALWEAIGRERAAGATVLVMGAGPIDAWVRERANRKK